MTMGGTVARGVLVAGGLAVLAPAGAGAQSCPRVIADATRLVLVKAETMDEERASLELFVRDKAGRAWRRVGQPREALIGRGGMAWGHTFGSYRRNGEPVKREGDKRTPAGFFRIGASFGFSPSNREGHVVLKRDETVCVDDARSPHYNTVKSRAEIGPEVSGENMRNYAVYRHGLFVDYPSSREEKAGSCIFLHLKSKSGRGTLGCIAMSEMDLLGLQQFAEPGAVLGVLPAKAIKRFARCLGGL
jgi:L,D-peptidoglycan transpeptidase YkuD (ErfK/YbiS/YcfS/YnhG family)